MAAKRKAKAREPLVTTTEASRALSILRRAEKRFVWALPGCLDHIGACIADTQRQHEAEAVCQVNGHQQHERHPHCHRCGKDVPRRVRKSKAPALEVAA